MTYDRQVYKILLISCIGFILCLILAVMNSYGQTMSRVITPNQASFEWLKVEPDSNAPTRIEYEVFLTSRVNLNRQDPNLYDSLGKTEDNKYTVTFPKQGEYIVGVRTLKFINDNETPLYSPTISWCDDPNVVAGTQVPWTWYYFTVPEAPKGLGLIEDNIIEGIIFD